MTSPLFELSGARFAVPARTILEPLDLGLAPGRIHGLIGPNGSGKSTLVKMLARQLPPSDGMIAFDGRPLLQWSDRGFARRVAYMPQFTPSADGMNVRELVSLGRFPWHGTLGRFTGQDREKVQSAIAVTGLEDFSERLVDTLSGGERQRAWIALMLAQDTGCILLDEPTSALDIAQESRVLSLVRAINRDHGTTIVVVLHDINLAARTCDDIIALREGRIVAHGAASEIMTPGTLARIYGVPMGVLPHPTRAESIAYVQ